MSYNLKMTNVSVKGTAASERAWTDCMTRIFQEPDHNTFIGIEDLDEAPFVKVQKTLQFLVWQVHIIGLWDVVLSTECPQRLRLRAMKEIAELIQKVYKEDPAALQALMNTVIEVSIGKNTSSKKHC